MSSLPVPLTVRLVTARRDVYVTRDLRDLRMGWSVPGGYRSASIDLDRPLLTQPDEIAHYGRMVVYDGRNGRVAWDGRLEDLGRGGGGDGQVWKLAAVGPSAHASDRTVPLIYVDRRTEPWQTMSTTARPFQRSGGAADTTPAISFRVPVAAILAANNRAEVFYRAIADAGMLLARVSAGWDVGVSTTQWNVQLRTSIGGGAQTQVQIADWNIAGGTLAGSRGGSPAITAGHNWAHLWTETELGGTVGAEDAWTDFVSIVVRALLKDATGNDITTGYTTNTVLASEVVADLLGRLLTKFDGTSATIATTTHPIDQLAYPDGATSRKVFDDLAALEAGHYWAAWEQLANGKHRFEYVPWPATVRYEASAADGFDSPGSAQGLWNAVTVRGRDVGGEIRSVRRTSVVKVLDDAGLTRETSIDLGDEVWSQANAERAGDQFLAEHQFAPNAGTLTVARPIYDLTLGRMVEPWEIRPGLIRVRGVRSRVDALNATARDGVTIFRITGHDFQASQAAAVLTLDSRPRTMAETLAELIRRPVFRRR